MKVIDCQYKIHGKAILALFNDAITNSTALYEYQLRTPTDIEQWFKKKSQDNFPVIGIESSIGTLMGFASYGQFRPYPANRFTVEQAVYVSAEHQGKGVGKALLEQLIIIAEQQKMHVIIAAIDDTNKTSISLHERLGYVHSGTLKEVGFKFDRWLNLAFYQKCLSNLNSV